MRSGLKRFMILVGIWVSVPSFSYAVRIAFWSSWQKNCGLATYTEHMKNALNERSHDVFIYEHDMSDDLVVKRVLADKIDFFNIQYIQGLFPAKRITAVIRTLKQMSPVKILLTVHAEDKFLTDFVPYVDKFLFFKEPISFRQKEKIAMIRLGLPIVRKKLDRNALREKYGFSTKDIVITTFGFLMRWKELPETLDAIVPYLQKNKNVKIQLLTSRNSFVGGFDQETKSIEKIIKEYHLARRVVFITDFLSQTELTERLALSDVGFLWGNVTSRASSGASREFATAKVPLVTTDCDHYETLGGGVVKVRPDRALFVKTVFDLVKDKNKQLALRYELEDVYNQQNYLCCAQRLEEICFSCGGSGHV